MIESSETESIRPTDRATIAPRASRRWWLGTALVVGLLAGVVAFTGFAAPVPASLGGTASSLSTSLSSATTNSSYGCNAVFTHTPSALYIQLPNPAKNLTPNGTIQASLEVEIVNYTSANNGTLISFPGIFYKFPLATGGNFSMFIAPKSIAITSAGWTNASLMQRTDKVTAGIDFLPHGKASLTSMKVAVMANAHYGQLQVEVRWQYANTPAGKTHLVPGSWSVPSLNISGKQLPSIFEPAPFVQVVNATGTTAVIGNSYYANLTGTVGGERFFLEMEQPGGHVVQAMGQTAPVNATNFQVSIVLLNYDHYLSPGPYLVHIHDQCGAMLFNKVITLHYPTVGQIDFLFQPSTCGSITLNGTKYTNGTVGNFTPSPTGYAFSVAGCKGYKFSNWTTTGALHISSGSSIVVSGSGTFTIRFH